MPILFLFANVLTLVGLPPTPCGLLLFLAKALRLWDSVILAALAAGTHFGYFLFEPLADFLPHLLKPPPFFLEPISTQSCLNHSFRPAIVL